MSRHYINAFTLFYDTSIKKIELSAKSIFVLFIVFGLLLRGDLAAQSSDNQESTRFKGAELMVSNEKKNKIEVKLQVYYSSMQMQIPEAENLTVYWNEKKPIVQNLELKKEIEIMNVIRPNSSSNQLDRHLGMKSVLYTAQLDIEKDHGVLDFIWTYIDYPHLISNIKKNLKDAIGLTVQLNDSKSRVQYPSNFLGLFPYFTVKQNSVIEDTWDIPLYTLLKYTIPYIDNPSSKSKAKEGGVKNAELNSIVYNPGFSEEQPLGNSFSLNRVNKEIKLDSLPFGNYLLPISVGEKAYDNTKSNHQAIYFIQSIF